MNTGKVKEKNYFWHLLWNNDIENEEEIIEDEEIKKELNESKKRINKLEEKYKYENFETFEETKKKTKKSKKRGPEIIKKQDKIQNKNELEIEERE